MPGIMFKRAGTDPVGHLLNADSILRMPEIHIEVLPAGFYEGVGLTAAEPAEAAPA